jgi:RNA polymerase sigma factor (sigma-70 family)
MELFKTELARLRHGRRLDDAAVAALTARAWAGDDAAKAQLVEGHLWLALSLAIRYRDNGVSVEDLLQEGNVVLLRVFERPLPPKFTAYASGAIRRHLRTYIACFAGVVQVESWTMFPPKDRRRADWQRPRKPVYVQLEPSLPAVDLDAVAEAVTADQFLSAWNQLTAYERTVLGLRFGHVLTAHFGVGENNHLSQSEAAARLGVSSATVSMTTTYALRKLVRALGGETLKRSWVRGFARLTPEQRREQSRRALDARRQKQRSESHTNLREAS